MLDKLIDGEIEMDTFEVVDKVVDKVVYESDLAAVEELANQIGEDVDDLSAQLRALREELHKKGVVDSLFLG
jgi:division protein CdvB (Snf7/Vps24/ESCRT-III family)